MKWLEVFIDQFLDEMSKHNYHMMILGNIPKEMIDSDIPTDDDWVGWKPIKSIIDDNDLDLLEKKIGIGLPLSFRHFFKYKHFFELKIPDYAVSLPDSIPDKELPQLEELVFNSLEPELIIGKRYIYFADFYDYGILCFDANENLENNEYRIVFIDHEDLDDIHHYADNFRELMEKGKGKGNKFVEYLNNYYAQKRK